MTVEEWERVCGAAGQAVALMHKRWDAGMETADQKMALLKDKVVSLQARTQLLEKGDWLAPKKAQIAALEQEHQVCVCVCVCVYIYTMYPCTTHANTHKQTRTHTHTHTNARRSW